MRETWYEVERYRYGKDFSWLKSITVVKETDKTVTVEEFHPQTNWSKAHITTARRNKDNSLFKTKFEAEAEVTRRLTEKIWQAEDTLNLAKAEFEKWFLRA